MKLLLLSVALLFFTGVQSNSDVQQDEPGPFSLWTFLEETVEVVYSSIINLDYSEVAKELNINEKLYAAKGNYDKIEAAVDDYFEEAWKRLDEDLHKNVPLFRTKVVPVLKEFEDKVEAEVVRVGSEFSPIASALISGLKQHMTDFCDKMEKIASSSRDKLRAEIDDLRTKVQPYAEDVKEEYKKYTEDLKGSLEVSFKEYQEEIRNEYKQLNEKLQPYLENLKFDSSYVRKLHKKINKLLSEFLESVKEKHKGKRQKH